MTGRLTPDDGRDLLLRAVAALKIAGADDGLARLGGGLGRGIRFARNGITTNESVRSMKLTLHASVGKRSASIAGNRLDDASLAQMSTEVVANARALPENQEHMPSLGPQSYDDNEAWFSETADLEPAPLANIAGRVIASARDRDVTAAGYAASGDWLRGVATFNGVVGLYPSSRIRLTTTARTNDGTGSGWASSFARQVPQLAIDHVAEGSVQRALSSRDPQPLEPGTYPVILEPQAVAGMLRYLLRSLNARSADEGRSYFSKPGGGNKLDTRIWDSPITLRSDPGDVLTPSSPFDNQGLPHRPVTWVEDGVLRNLTYSRYWAKTNSRDALARPRSWLLEGRGNPTPLVDMIATAERAILITRLHYIRMVDSRQLLVTGLTRDGLFLVENGKITKPLRNFRFNESPIEVLQHATQFSAPEIVGSGMAMPALSVSKFRFTSVSDAI